MSISKQQQIKLQEAVAKARGGIRNVDIYSSNLVGIEIDNKGRVVIELFDDTKEDLGIWLDECRKHNNGNEIAVTTPSPKRQPDDPIEISFFVE